MGAMMASMGQSFSGPTPDILIVRAQFMVSRTGPDKIQSMNDTRNVAEKSQQKIDPEMRCATDLKQAREPLSFLDHVQSGRWLL